MKDGHWHAEDEDAEKAAWEESVRLREQMFWSRIGGGVIPATAGGAAGNQTTVPPTPVTPVAPFTTDEPNTDGSDDKEDLSPTEKRENEVSSIPAKPPPPLPPRARPVVSTIKPAPPPENDNLAEATEAGHSGSDAEKVEAKTASEPSDNPTPTPDDGPSEKEEPKRLSVTIPGAYDSSS